MQAAPNVRSCFLVLFLALVQAVKERSSSSSSALTSQGKVPVVI